MDTATAEHVDVRVDSAREIEERLNAAVRDLQPLAASARHGILVTRHNPGHFTVSLSQDVPFGLTREAMR